MHVDGQQIVALGIVAVAALAVGRRLWGQVAAFRGRPGRAGTGGSGCDGCPSSGATPKTQTTSSPLMQIQTKPPVHLRRPPSEG
jgi:hypothetical protein